MKIPKHQFDLALKDLAEMALSYTSRHSLNYMKEYDPKSSKPEEGAYQAGQIAGVVMFLSFAKAEAERSYSKLGIEAE